MELKGQAFHKRVRQGYLDQAQAHPDRYAVIDATHDELHVRRATLEALRNHFAASSTPSRAAKPASPSPKSTAS